MGRHGDGRGGGGGVMGVGGGRGDLPVVMTDRGKEQRESLVRKKSVATSGASGWLANSVTT